MEYPFVQIRSAVLIFPSQPPCCSPIIFPCWVSMKKLFWENIWILLLMGNVTSEGIFVKVTIIKFFFAQKEMELWRGKKCTILCKQENISFSSVVWLQKWQNLMTYPLLLLPKEVHQDNFQASTQYWALPQTQLDRQCPSAFRFYYYRTQHVVKPKHAREIREVYFPSCI